MKFDLAKAMANGGKCLTRNGHPARIICTDARRPDPIAVLVEYATSDYLRSYRADGRFYPSGRESEYDLINIPERHVRWVNCYPSGHAYGYETRAYADTMAAADRIACIRIEFEDGEGL